MSSSMRSSPRQTVSLGIGIILVQKDSHTFKKQKESHTEVHAAEVAVAAEVAAAHAAEAAEAPGRIPCLSGQKSPLHHQKIHRR